MLKVSIITVSYNSAPTIEDTISSVLSQSYDNIEYIIIDGGSTDGTIEIINQVKDDIAYFVSENDNGLYDAMNKGIDVATGDIIGMINSDDVYFSSNIIETVVRNFIEYECDSLYGDLLYVKVDNLNDVVRYWKSSVYKKGSFSQGFHPPHPTFFVTKETYLKYGNFNLKMDVSADFELMLRFLEKNEISTKYVSEILVKMRIGGESNKSLKNIIKGNRDILKAFKINGIKINPVIYLYKRLFPKLKQFVFKNY